MFTRMFPLSASVVLIAALGLSACNKEQPKSSDAAPAAANSATAPATTPAAPDAANSTVATSAASAAPAVSQPATVSSGNAPMANGSAAADSTPSLATRDRNAAPAVASVVVPAGSTLHVRLDNPISTKTAQPGQQFNATISSPVTRNGRTIIPTGTAVSGEITQAAQAGRFKGGALLSLKLTAMTLRGRNYNLSTSSVSQTSKARGKRTAIVSGGGAALGGIIGGIAGGGKGAMIGLASGAGAGAAGSALTGNRDVVLASETPLAFRTTASVTLR